jgi:alpha/beta superfamily hydrolase
MDIVLAGLQGCGRSKGRVTWGVEELNDFHRVMDFVRNTHPGEPIAISGFSMGAAVALMGAHHYPEIACMVSNSPRTQLLCVAAKCQLP